jgi:hypothetical protein
MKWTHILSLCGSALWNGRCWLVRRGVCFRVSRARRVCLARVLHWRVPLPLLGLFVLPLTHLRLNVTRKAEVGGDGDNKDARVVGKSFKKKNFSAFRSTLHRCSPLLIHAAPIMHRKKALDAQEPCHAVLDGSQRNAQASWEGQRHGGARPERPVFFFFFWALLDARLPPCRSLFAAAGSRSVVRRWDSIMLATST